MNYTELLNTTEWKSKRKEILKRDNYQCQRCGYNSNNDIFKSWIITFTEDLTLLFVSDEFNSDMKIVKYFDSDDKCWHYFKSYLGVNIKHNKKETFVILSIIAKNKVKQLPFNGASINNLGNIPMLDLLVNKKVMLLLRDSLKNDIDFTLYDVDKESIYLAEEKRYREFTKSNNLHVHHKCYRKTKKIWEQKNDDYVTLCNVCHRIIHENQLIPYYNEHGDIYQYMNNCSRCGGLGYLDCYKHVEGGVCYRCNGSGYQTDLNSF